MVAESRPGIASVASPEERRAEPVSAPQPDWKNIRESLVFDFLPESASFTPAQAQQAGELADIAVNAYRKLVEEEKIELTSAQLTAAVKGFQDVEAAEGSARGARPALMEVLLRDVSRGRDPGEFSTDHYLAETNLAIEDREAQDKFQHALTREERGSLPLLDRILGTIRNIPNDLKSPKQIFNEARQRKGGTRELVFRAAGTATSLGLMVGFTRRAREAVEYDLETGAPKRNMKATVLNTLGALAAAVGVVGFVSYSPRR